MPRMTLQPPALEGVARRLRHVGEMPTLAECNGQRQEAARRLGWGRNTLTRKIKELGLNDL